MTSERSELENLRDLGDERTGEQEDRYYELLEVTSNRKCGCDNPDCDDSSCMHPYTD